MFLCYTCAFFVLCACVFVHAPSEACQNINIHASGGALNGFIFEVVSHIIHV